MKITQSLQALPHAQLVLRSSALLASFVLFGGAASASSLPLATTLGSSNIGSLLLCQASSCSPNWVPSFGVADPDTSMSALTVFDDGSGPSLYAGGSFTVVDGVAANRIAKWNGSSWSAVGSGMTGGLEEVNALAVHDDGSGPALYAGGSFTTAGGVAANRIAKWNGSSWSAVGSGITGVVSALAVHDDGSGPALYAGGQSFMPAPVGFVARWNGSSWSAVGSGMDGNFGVVSALAVHDDGGGPALYAGGSFTTAGGVAANGIAKWNGSSWSAVGSGMDGVVSALVVHDDGSGPALYAGGSFTTAGGVPVSKIARWKGASWSALGGGLSGNVFALAVFDDGGGLALYAGGSFTTAGGVAASQIAKWNGSSWSALGNGLSRRSGDKVSALTTYDGAGAALYAGGTFSLAGEVFSNGIARWNVSGWSKPGSVTRRGIDASVYALTSFDDGSGSALYAGGDFVTADGVLLNHVGRWDGSNWSALGGGMNGDVSALAVHDDGSGPALYAGGGFRTAGGVVVNGVARWNGSSWSALGSGVDGYVSALAVHDGGNGPALYAGGRFTGAGGLPAANVAKWDGTSWSALANGPGFDVNGMATCSAGLFSSPSLYVGGDRVAKWNGVTWDVIGVPSWYFGNGEVSSLTVYNAGSIVETLIVGGFFQNMSGVHANNVAEWDGSSWSPLGIGISAEIVYALKTHNDDGHWALFGAGLLGGGGGVAKWNGSSWSELGSGTSDSVFALATFDDGAGPALYAGGSFLSAYDSGDGRVAKWGCGPDVVWVDFAHTGAETGTFFQPFNTLLEGVGAVQGGGFVRIRRAGTSSETGSYANPCTITTHDGPATIGP